MSGDPEDEDDATLLADEDEDEDEDASDPQCTTTTPGMTKREYALRELLESERTYSKDLIFMRDLHMPLASGTCFPYGLRAS